MYLNEYGQPTSILVKVSPQDTSKAAASAQQPQAPGSEFNPPPPRAVQDILDELNVVRIELSELEAARDKSMRKGGSPGNPYPVGNYYRPLTMEDIQRDKRIRELCDRECELHAEFNAAKELMMNYAGAGPVEGDATVIGEDRA